MLIIRLPLFIDNGSTRVSSAEGNVDARGEYFIGNRDLYIQVKGCSGQLKLDTFKFLFS